MTMLRGQRPLAILLAAIGAALAATVARAGRITAVAAENQYGNVIAQVGTLAKASGIPVVGVYETMPRPGFSYQSWMLAETAALKSAITARTSTEHL